MAGGGEVACAVGVSGSVDRVSSAAGVGTMPIPMVPVHPVREGRAIAKSQTISLYEPVRLLIIISIPFLLVQQTPPAEAMELDDLCVWTLKIARSPRARRQPVVALPDSLVRKLGRERPAKHLTVI